MTEQLTDEILQARAKAGAELLDKLKPCWYRSVRLDTLKLSDCSDCVLGQLFGGYGYGVFVLRRHLRDVDAAANGFTLTCEEADRASITETDELYARLTEFWKVEIQNRRNS